MNEDQKINFKALVEAEITKSKADIDRLKEESKPVPPSEALGRLTRMEAIQNKNVRLANLEDAKVKLQKLTNVLHHIDDDDFGLCVICGDAIPEKRLLLVPESRKCVSCAA